MANVKSLKIGDSTYNLDAYNADYATSAGSASSASYASSAGNADTLDGLHASAFERDFGTVSSVDDKTTTGVYHVNVGVSPSSNHGTLFVDYSIGTPYQLYVPDHSHAYIYKRYLSSGAWTEWFKLSAGYADSANYASSANYANSAGSASSASSAGNADTLDGYHGSGSQAASTYVLRDGNGYIYTNYINSNTSNSENPGIGQVIVTNGSDGYYRKASLAHLKSSLGSMPPYFANSTWYTVGDDCAVGDHDIAGTFCIKGLNGTPGINLYSSDNSYYATVINSANIGSQSVNYSSHAGYVSGTTFVV